MMISYDQLDTRGKSSRRACEELSRWLMGLHLRESLNCVMKEGSTSSCAGHWAE